MIDSLDYQFFYKYFKNYRSFDAKQFDLALDHCQNYASEYGLSEEDLILLSKVAFNVENLGVTRLRKIVKCMIPRRSVPEEAAENVMNWVLDYFNKDISQFSKKLVLQWLIGTIVYNLTDASKTIDLYYDIFWYFLPYSVTSSSACHIIYLLTKTTDISRWYVKQALQVHNDFGKPKHTGALLLLFKSCRPEMVPENIPAYAVHKAFGNLPEFITKNFSKAQELMESQNMMVKSVEGICWNTMASTNIKKKGIELIPKITECEAMKFDRSKTLTSFTDDKNLYKYLIEGHSPTSALSLLSCREGMFILIFGDNNLQHRFSIQLYYTLYDAFFERNALVSYEEKDNLLQKIVDLQNYLQQGIPVVSKFLAQYLIRWDGRKHEKYVYQLIEWINFPNYLVLHESILIFIYDLFITGDMNTKIRILKSLGKLCVNIITTFQNRINLKLKFLFLDYCTIDWDFMDTINSLYKFLESLFQLGLVTESANSILIYTIIQVIFMILNAETRIGIQVFTLPEFLFSSVLVSPNPICLMTLSDLFNRYPKYVPETIKQDFASAIFYKKFSVSNEIKKIFSPSFLNELKTYNLNFDASLSFDRHLALECYNFQAKKEYNYREFLEYAKKNYPQIMVFLGNIV